MNLYADGISKSNTFNLGFTTAATTCTVTSSVILYDSSSTQITTPSWVISIGNSIKGYDVKIGPATAVSVGSYKLIVKGVLDS